MYIIVIWLDETCTMYWETWSEPKYIRIQGKMGRGIRRTYCNWMSEINWAWGREVDWIRLAQVEVHLRVLLNEVMYLRIPGERSGVVWFRHCATSWKVAGLIPDEIIRFFNWHNLLGLTLGSTQSLTEMSTRNIPGGKGRPARKADNLTVICESIVEKMWEPRRLTTIWASTVCWKNSFTLCFALL
jgi:hypothetical protein